MTGSTTSFSCCFWHLENLFFLLNKTSILYEWKSMSISYAWWTYLLANFFFFFFFLGGGRGGGVIFFSCLFIDVKSFRIYYLSKIIKLQLCLIALLMINCSWYCRLYTAPSMIYLDVQVHHFTANYFSFSAFVSYHDQKFPLATSNVFAGCTNLDSVVYRDLIIPFISSNLLETASLYPIKSLMCYTLSTLELSLNNVCAAEERLSSITSDLAWALLRTLKIDGTKRLHTHHLCIQSLQYLWKHYENQDTVL